MLGYVCKYAPVEVFISMGVAIERIEPEVTNFTQADTLMHPNVCAFAKAVLEAVSMGDYEGVILTNCCDSIRRLYDTLTKHYPDKFFYLMDVPRKVNEFAIGLYEKHLLEMIRAYENFSGRKFEVAELHKLLQASSKAAAGGSLRDSSQAAMPVVAHASPQTVIPVAAYASPQKSSGNQQLHLGILGARCSETILDLLRERNIDILFDFTCTGLSRSFKIDDLNPLSSYCAEILYQFPCMRMVKAADRTSYLEGFTDRLDGILYHTIKFCDNYSFEYADLKSTLTVPLLPVETDSTKQSIGQIRTRVEAFIEELEQKKGICQNNRIRKSSDPRISSEPIHRKEGKTMYIIGIDSGSTSTNAVILNEKREIVATHVIRTGAKTADSAERILREILKKADLERTAISRIVSTGYGRISIPFADRNVTEISCHGKGAHFLNPNIRTILDIGGQDSKAIRLNEKGEVTDFVMNDKCAAGTGRFLEMMARTLEIEIDELGPVSLKWKESVAISSMCSVFAESEVISLIALNKERADIAHGVHRAIATKAMSLLKKVGLEPGFMMTGGVAKNPGVVAVLEELLGQKLFLSSEPEIVGALGAALFALEDLS